MTDTISFYTNPFSRGRIAHWMLEEVGAPYHVELIDFERNALCNVLNSGITGCTIYLSHGG